MIHNRRGFSLIELILVMAIILVIIAIGTPYILRSMQTAYDASAVAYLRQMQRAQENYRVVNREYAKSFDQLGVYITDSVPTGQGGTPPGQGGTLPGQGGTPPGQAKKGAAPPDQNVNSMYIFELTRLDADNWECTAEPVRDRTANRYFFTDNSGVIRFAFGSLADASSSPI